MHNRISILGMILPAYGTIVLFGVVIVTFIGMITAWQRKLCVESYIKLECIGGVAAVIGAKIWDMLTEFFETEGYVISHKSYMDSGLSFYGGLILGMCFVYVTSLLLRVDFYLYAKNLIFLVPLLHGIWKIGCFMGGCCYGIPYNRFGSVTYPDGVKAPAGIELFPVQLLEAGILFLMTVFFFIRGRKKQWKYPVLEYLGCYSGVRFFVEFFRWHRSKRIISGAQMTSLVLIAVVFASFCLKERNRIKRNKDEQ